MNRKLILHIGHAKTGTTALQKTLVASHARLLAQGILHPSTTPHKHNHRVLIPYLLVDEDQESRSPEILAAKTLWQDIVKQIDSEDPHTIVLSSEQLFQPWRPAQMRAMLSKLRSVATHVTVVAYIREPAALVLSSLQQDLKSKALPSTGLSLPNPRSALEAFQNSGFDCLSVRTFDRHTLYCNNIVQDFFTSFLPDFKVSDIVSVDERNVSMSAEAMAILQDIQSGNRRFYIGKPRREVPRADERLEGLSRPQLLPEIQDAIRASYQHYDWLDENFNVTFYGLDVPDMGVGPARNLLSEVKTVEDICKVDTGRKSRLWQSLSRPHAILMRLFNPA